MITKSDYLLYKQCPKSLWLKKHQPDAIDTGGTTRFLEKGNEVTEEARTLFPGGELVVFERNIPDMVHRTKSLIEQGVSTIYEAAFSYDGCLVICDILHREEGEDEWDIYEVKSATAIKSRYRDDVAFQQVVAGNNIPVRSVSVVYLNNQYTRDGALEHDKLFLVEDMTEECVTRTRDVLADITAIKALVRDSEPLCDIGMYCNKYGKDNFPCGAKAHCWSHVPEYSVFNISRIGKKAFDLYYQGMTTLDDVPDGYPISALQRFQVDAYKTKQEVFQLQQVKRFLSGFDETLYFLDFETYQQAIPLYDGVKPYQQLPFQYSLHMHRKGKELVHHEFLAKEGSDPRRALAEALVSVVPAGVMSVAYNMSFEKMVLRSLADDFPDLREHLLDIASGMVDLMIPFQKKWVYRNDMRGSYSIKYVLPALLPNEDELDYQQLDIQNGSMAMEVYERLHTETPERIREIREGLLAYCRLDTLAMVRIWEKLWDMVTAA